MHNSDRAHQATDQDIRRDHLMELLEREIATALTSLDGDDPFMSRMVRYHLGFLDASGEETSADTRATVQGKRVRPILAMLSAAAVGGTPQAAAPIAAAIELLHNFTLIHDDIMDRSPNRRHRPTVWRLWGDAQAINAGDALFAASQLAAIQSRQAGLPAETTLELADAFNRCTIDIVRGQISDLRFEGRDDVTPDDYLEMIRGKTSAIVRFAAWAGAVAGGAPKEQADALADVGEAVGMGFQIRDDMLGIWSPAEETGKDAADDIRRRKQSLPILMLRQAANAEDEARIAELYAADEINPAGVAEVLAMLDRYAIQVQVATHVDQQHDRAFAALERALPNESPASHELRTLITELGSRRS